jgi:hypothetical protein
MGKQQPLFPDAPTPPADVPAPPPVAPAPKPPRPLDTTVLSVLRAIEKGLTTAEAIAADTGRTERAVHATLVGLCGGKVPSVRKAGQTLSKEAGRSHLVNVYALNPAGYARLKASEGT